MSEGGETKIGINFVPIPDRPGVILTVVSEKELLVGQYLEIIEWWLAHQKKVCAKEIAEYEDLKKSGKVVSLAQWKRGS